MAKLGSKVEQIEVVQIIEPAGAGRQLLSPKKSIPTKTIPALHSHIPVDRT
jgi:hypothetical protein